MRILIADRHSIFRIGLKHVLSEPRPEIHVIEANSIDESIDTAMPIDLAIVELSAPGMDGGNGIVRLCARRDNLAVIVVAGDVTRASAMRAVAHGAMGLVPKSTTGEELLEAIDTVMDGRVWLPRAAIQPAERNKVGSPGGGTVLDPRQLERLNSLTP
jgi:DNA-binding NarL/FixJ family response regulator